MRDNKIDEIGGYPSPFAPKKVKDSKAYGLKYFKSMYKEWSGQGENSIAGRKRRFNISRSYANGSQSTDKYKSLLNNSGDQSYMNLDWSNLSIIPKFVDVIVNGLAEQEYEMKAVALDRVSLNKRIKDRSKYFINMINKDFNKQFTQLTGMEQPKNDFTPESSEELDLYMSLNYKQKNELAIEQALNGIKELNDYSETRIQLLRDLTVCGMAVAKTHTDPVKGIKIKYVDPSNFIHSHSKKSDCKDLFHAGEVRRMTIGEIRRLAKPGELLEKDLEDIARRYGGKDNNPHSFNSTSIFNAELGYEEYEYDSFTIEVLDACFKSDYKVVYEKKTNKHGQTNVYRKKEGYKMPKRSKYKRELIEQPASIYYTGIYIVGTDHVINYGPMQNMVRKKSSLDETPCPYVVYIPNIHHSTSKSLVERMMPFADQVQLAHLKMQLVIAKARPKGAAFELGSLENVGKGDGATFTPLELQDIYDQTGNIYYRRQDDEGTQSQVMPIQELENGIGRDMQSLIAIYNHNLQIIRDVTGINEARDATQPSNKALIGTQKLALMASNNATKHINNGELNITKRLAEHCVLRLQDLIKYSPLKKKYTDMLGEAVIESISMGKDFHLNEFGLAIEIAPDEEEKQMFEQNIQMSIQQKELRLEDAIFIRAIRNIKMANQMLILRRKKYQEEQAQQQQQQQQQAQQMQQQQAQAALQQVQTEKQLEAKTSTDLENLKHKHEMERLQLEYDLRMQLKEVENDGLSNKEQVKVDGTNKAQETATEGKIEEQNIMANAGKEKEQIKQGAPDIPQPDALTAGPPTGLLEGEI
jgi:hypothetical protein